ncbi:MAG: hypothetical protein B6245_17500, partial [Desulfobacteraceae bacterium 4572_88]
LPGTDGCEITRKIRAMESDPQCRTVIIAMIASELDWDQRTAIAAGCDDFLSKPFAEADIFDLMNKHIGVCFAYEPPASGRSGKETLKDAPPEALKALPKELPSLLKQSIIEGNKREILERIQAIREHEPEIADALERMTRKFQYKKMIMLIQKGEEENE